MQIVKVNKQLLNSRNQLLQRTMRPEELPFTVSDEYPIVLNRRDTRYSFCLTDNDRVIAHANLWPRKLFFKDSWTQVGLIGNVATDEAYRNQGLMKNLFNQLDSAAKSLHLSATILWSDLLEFYQKLGFESLSKEIRYFFRKDFVLRQNVPGLFKLVDAKTLSDDFLRQMLAIRDLRNPTIKRSVAEFRLLLQIPATHLYLLAYEDRVHGYFVIGKGADMINVVHEWAFSQPNYYLNGLSQVFRDFPYFDEVIVLCPCNLVDRYRIDFGEHASTYEEHMMALAKFYGDSRTKNRDLFSECFIWGLDSI